MMWKRGMVAMAWLLAGVAPAMAQPRVEIAGLVNWVLADGVTTDSQVIANDGTIYTKADPKDSASFGLSASVLVNANGEAGFIYSSQPTTLLFGGPSTEREAGDLTTTTYHAFYGYTFGGSEARVRPYLLFGMGATHFSAVDTTIGGQAHTTESHTQFSTTVGAGVKIFATPRFGLRAGARWSPARVPADSAGWWCDDVSGCFVIGGTKYATQVELGGGVFVRF